MVSTSGSSGTTESRDQGAGELGSRKWIVTLSSARPDSLAPCRRASRHPMSFRNCFPAKLNRVRRRAACRRAAREGRPDRGRPPAPGRHWCAGSRFHPAGCRRGTPWRRRGAARESGSDLPARGSSGYPAAASTVVTAAPVANVERRQRGPPAAAARSSSSKSRADQRQNHLGLGIAEAAVELDHVGRAGSVDHEPGVEHAR